jgi:predicted AAA+ superfamily ATPase
MIYTRFLPIEKLSKEKSLLLLGPRQTGKTSLLRKIFPDSMYINLAEADTYREITSRPELIRQRVFPDTKMLIIDEAQKIPEVFDEAQVLIDTRPDLRIILTGSSARKLRREGVNLLPGRIWQLKLYPLVFPELGKGQTLKRLCRGSMPGFYDSPHYRKELNNYVGLYLDEEVRAEGLVRGIGDFSRFLTVAALSNTNQINYSKIASDTGIKVNTVRSYFEILEDTLVGKLLPGFSDTIKRKAVSAPKFYFFDNGIVNSLLSRFEISPQNELYGSALEHLIFLELSSYISYHMLDHDLTYWRTYSKFEVDFVIKDKLALEVKSKSRITVKDEKGILALTEEASFEHKVIICNESAPRITDSGIEIYPVEDFLEKLWEGYFI